MRVILSGLGALILLAVAYLLAWPVPIRPVAFTLSTAPGYVGVHAVNTKLAGLKLIDLHGEVGPEHIAFGPDGKLYTTVASGNILRMNADGSDQAVFANTGGRVLGFDFDASGKLIAADAIKGLLSIALDGKIWLGFAKPRNPKADAMADKPWLRRLSLRLPRALWPIPPSYGHVIAFTEDGKIVADLQDPTGSYPETTAITETKDRLYVQSLHAHGLGWLPKP